MENNTNKRGFGSDNNAGIHPDILKEIISSNTGTQPDMVQMSILNKHRIYSKNIRKWNWDILCLYRTAANVLGLSGILKSWNSGYYCFDSTSRGWRVRCSWKFIGAKFWWLMPWWKNQSWTDWKNTCMESILNIILSLSNLYYPGNGNGDCLLVDEIARIASFAHNRICCFIWWLTYSNAAVSLSLPFKAFTTDAGVDVLSFGGTKNGMMCGESICFLKPGAFDWF